MSTKTPSPSSTRRSMPDRPLRVPREAVQKGCVRGNRSQRLFALLRSEIEKGEAVQSAKREKNGEDLAREPLARLVDKEGALFFPLPATEKLDQGDALPAIFPDLFPPPSPSEVALS